MLSIHERAHLCSQTSKENEPNLCDERFESLERFLARGRFKALRSNERISRKKQFFSQGSS